MSAYLQWKYTTSTPLVWNHDLPHPNYSVKTSNIRYSGIPISRTSSGNANWFEKSGVLEIEGGIKLRLIGRVLFDYE